MAEKKWVYLFDEVEKAEKATGGLGRGARLVRW